MRVCGVVRLSVSRPLHGRSSLRCHVSRVSRVAAPRCPTADLIFYKSNFALLTIRLYWTRLSCDATRLPAAARSGVGPVRPEGAPYLSLTISRLRCARAAHGGTTPRSASGSRRRSLSPFARRWSRGCAYKMGARPSVLSCRKSARLPPSPAAPLSTFGFRSLSLNAR